jgi:MFS transporter, FHS family, glucose/mannose:H+ symporter
MASPSTRPSESGARTEWLLLHISFTLIGVITTLLGPILPFFARHWTLTDAQSGFFFTTQYFGSFLGVVLTSIIIPRFGSSRVCAGGFTAFMACFAFLGLGPWTLAAFLVGINGFGYGLTSPTINMRATQLPSRNTAAAVTLVNLSWSIGAVCCPFLIGSLIPLIGVRGFCLALAGLSLVLVLSHLSLRSARVAAVSARSTHSLSEWLEHLRQPQAIPLVLLFFLYVGVEVALGGWVATHEKRMPGMGAAALLLAPSVFYGFLLFGRGVAPLALRRISQLVISVGGLLLATLGSVLIALSVSPHQLYLGAAIAGFGLAPQYPIFVTWLAAIYRADSTWMAALFFGAAGLGAAVLPWVVGIVAARTDSLRVGLYIPVVVCALMVLLDTRARPRTQ